VAAAEAEDEDPGCRLYLLSPGALITGGLALEEFARLLESALDAGDVASFQLRLKDVPDAEIERAARLLLPIVQGREVAFILNDRPDLAAALGCDGVHVGQEDAPYREARRLVGPDRIVGVTCKQSHKLALDAADEGADYVAFGAFFPSTTKVTSGGADLKLLRDWRFATNVPSVAIGGITSENCGPVVEAGADFLCIASGVWDHPGGPAAGVRAVNDAIAQVPPRA
jgi:thiamine-phosphate pyrophosphorylase